MDMEGYAWMNPWSETIGRDWVVSGQLGHGEINAPRRCRRRRASPAAGRSCGKLLS